MKTSNQVDLVNDFLALPKTALPQAFYLDAQNERDLCNAWELLREYVADPDGCMRWEARIALIADRDGWRDQDNVVVTI